MSMDENERRRAVLRYAASVPEWGLALKHQAAAELSGCAGQLMTVCRMMLDSDARDRLYPNRIECGMPPRGYERTILYAEQSLGRAVSALEIVASLSDEKSIFPASAEEGSDDAMRQLTASYSVSFAELESLCRGHGMEEVSYQHG